MLTSEQQILEQIKRSKNILISFNRVWRGDAVASALALYLFLSKMDKNVDLVADCLEQEHLCSFLPAYDKIKCSLESLRKFIISVNLKKTKINQVKYKIEDDNLNFYITPTSGSFSKENVTIKNGDFKYDLIITVDTPDLEALGKTYESETDFFYRTPVINIDHHPNNENFGQINYVQLTAVSSTEILFYLFDIISRDLIDENIATCLLAGMISETKSFKTTNITPQTLSVAAQLISLGARREEIVNNFYRSRSLNMLKLWGRILARLTGLNNNQIVYSLLSNNDFIKTNLTEIELVDVIDEMLVNIPQAQIIIIFYEQLVNKVNHTNVLIYSTKNIDALNLVKEYNPAGTKSLVKFSTDYSLEEAKNKIMPLIEERVAKMI